jgi:uracil-DNA glycosylase
MRTLDQLIEAIRQEALREPFPIDLPIYEKAGKDPNQPILFAGNLAAQCCVFGRDLGKDEVAQGEPLIGAGGRLVRSGFYEKQHGRAPEKSNVRVESALQDTILTNTVPFKPPGNKAYREDVKDRFRPLIVEFLIEHWQGDQIITLGNEAFDWFARYADEELVKELWARDDRYEQSIRCELLLKNNSEVLTKQVVVSPLPHPSPLNAKWYKRFPELLMKRLVKISP